MEQSTGKVILSQLQMMGRMIMWCWGCSNFKTFTEDQLPELGGHMGGLLFQVNGRLYKGQVLVKLNGKDLYDIHLGSLKSGKWIETKKIEDVFVEDLINVIDQEVETSVAA